MYLTNGFASFTIISKEGCLMRKLVGCIITLLLMTAALAACTSSSPGRIESSVQNSGPEESTQAAETMEVPDTTRTLDTTEEITVPTGNSDPAEAEQESAKTTGVAKPTQTENSKSTEPTHPVTTKPTEPPHTHSYTSSKVASTCTNKGYTLHKCSCGKSYTDNETAALGHSWGDWTVVTQPTTQQEGKQTRTCSRCGATESQSIPKVEAPALEWSDLDLNKAMAVGNQYAASRYGCVPDTSLNINTPNVGYNFPNSLSRGEIISYVPSLAGSYQEAIEFEIKGNVDLFVQDFIYSGYTEDDVRGAKINCWCVIQNNQLWFYVFYK